jgi:type VI secretion system protein VasD
MKYRLVILSILGLLGGCHSGTGIQTELKVTTADYLNPDIRGKASPVVLTVYELKSQKEFSDATFEQLTTNPLNNLKTSLIDIHHYELEPHSESKLHFNMTKDAHYLGMVAGYRIMNNSQWKKIIPLTPGKTSQELEVNLETNTIKLDKPQES